MSPNLPSNVEEVDPRPFLACHVYSPLGAEASSYYVAWPGRLAMLEPVDRDLKLKMELEHWIHLCLRLASPDGRKSMGPLFRAEFGDLDVAGIARTLRTLRGMEALLLGRNSFFPSIEAETQKASARVATLFGTKVEIRCGFQNPDWQVSLPLLLIRAAAWSQTGWQQPYLWEAYSAWYAQLAHHRKGWLGEPGRTILTFLVRFQSAPGQYARSTGDAHFFEAARDVADTAGLDLKLLLTALGLLAQAQDFRSAVLKPSPNHVAGPGPREEEQRLCCLHAHDHPLTNFAAFWKAVDSLQPNNLRRATWSYARWLTEPDKLKKKEARSFQDRIEKAHPGIVAFSFGRDYRSQAQKDRVVERVREALRAPADLEKFFTFNSIQIPDCLSPQKVETLVEIRLTDDVTAIDMVFSDYKSIGASQQSSTAWEIYCRLFRAGEHQKMILPGYCPTVLVGRFLEVAHRLRPADCISIPVRTNHTRSLFLHLPEVPPGTNPSSREVQAAARFVPAWVLNQVMMLEVTNCQIALEDLHESPRGQFWQGVINEAIEENHFKTLLHDYLSDYLTEPSRVLLEQGHVDLLPPLEAPSADPGSEAQALLQAIEAEGVGSPKSVVLGIDIGGTFVKMRFYRLEKYSKPHGASQLKALGRDFRILTEGPGKREELLENFVRRLCDRIRKEIAALHLPRVDALGVSWPGPVRDQRVQGTSGILMKLGFERDIKDNKITEIMKLDLVQRLAAFNFGTDEGAGRPVAFLNDGDAHALGTLAEAFLSRRLTSSDASGLGVVVKAGTGTAGALIHNGLPAPGLMEFGKLVIDLAFRPIKEKDYPEGVANLYCSSRTLPRLMGERLDHLRHLERLDLTIQSIEVGGLAEVETALAGGELTRARGVLKRLVWDSGKIAVAGFLRKIDPELDVVTLEELANNWQKESQSVLRKKLTRYLALDGADPHEAHKRFRNRIHSYGQLRLLLLLNLEDVDANAFWKIFTKPASRKNNTLRKQLRETTRTAQQAIDDLGIYVGDLLALLYFAHEMSYAVIGGGVLSHESGRRACRAAVERLNKYNEIDAKTDDLAGNLAIRFGSAKGYSSQAPVPSQDVSEQDPGTLGSALAGALELLRQKRLEGLKRVTEMVHRLKVMETLEVTKVEVKDVKKSSSVNLQSYALDGKGVRRHLDQAAPRLGLVRTLTDEADEKEGDYKYTYTRWLAN